MQKLSQTKSKSQTVYKSLWIKYDMSGGITHHSLKEVKRVQNEKVKKESETEKGTLRQQ